jgi:catechol 2,3-dioxygenase-like lactoylglutathione lyase family enzyme
MTALHHIGYWVDDLEAAVARAVRDLGIGPFLVDDHVAFDSFECPPGIAASDGPVRFDHTAAFAAWGSVVVEFDQVHDIDAGLAEAYGVRHGGVSHVSWVVDDLAAEADRLASLGCRLINTARTGPIHVSWHTGGPLFGHPVEVHEANPAILGMHGRLAVLGDGWDGVDPMRPMRPPAAASS